jgi:signal transduction histidine kinase
VIEFFRSFSFGDARTLALRLMQRTLFRKYVALFAAVLSSALVTTSLFDVWSTYRDHRTALVRIQQEQAGAAAARITQFIKEIEGHLGWTTHLSWSSPASEQRELDALRLLRQVPAIAELAMIDGQGREQLRVSRQAMDLVASNADFSQDQLFTIAAVRRVYYGPVYFRRASEPFMTLAVAGARRDAGVSVAEVNLTHIWDVVNTIRVGRSGQAYVVDAGGRLIAHPDISLVLRNTDLSQLPQVRAARAQIGAAGLERAQSARNARGETVLTAYATAEPLNWLVFVELPEREANEPLWDAITRSVLITLAGLMLALLAALFLARRMVVPIQTLTAGAARIGSGALDHRIAIETGDELQALGTQFNSMAAQLQASYASLERKVDERTQELQVANLAKSQFLAVASHDLRQPLHALNLLAAQLRSERDQAERARLAMRIDTAIANMNELFNALLDISKLDAGALAATVTAFPVADVLKRIDATFAAVARDKGLHFSVVASTAWVRSDAILLERVLNNLVSNALRYTIEGGIVVGCRRLGDRLRIDVCDSGMGIPDDQQRSIFIEFYRGPQSEERFGEGLGLGLAIVERLCALLDHQIGLVSTVGKGTRFSVSVPMVPILTGTHYVRRTDPGAYDPLRDRLVVVIDDDELVREGTAGLLRSWGCRVVAAPEDRAALADLDGAVPDLIICDYHLQKARTGIDAIAQIRATCGRTIPAFLISGDISKARLRETRAGGLHLLHKPVNPMALRAMISSLLEDGTRV